jgi:diaminopimelate epimerase
MITGRRFWKMTGSGNDFVFVDGRHDSTTEFESPEVIQRICARGTGVGADGLVILTVPKSDEADLALTYFNADGSLASLCGNATLCTAALAVRLRAVDPSGFDLETGSGVLRARVRDGVPEFDLPVIREARAAMAAIPTQEAEQRMGFAVAGIPHIVVQVADVAGSDVKNRGRQLRYDASLAEGANVNFVSPGGGAGRGGRSVGASDIAGGSAEAGAESLADSGSARPEVGRWRIRTYERGVEGETLACGTGSVATAILLRLWNEAGDDVELETASGQVLGVRSRQAPDGSWSASLRGEGRLVFEGEFGDW